LAKVTAIEVETGELLGVVDLRGKQSKARKRENRKGKFGLMYQAECADEILTSPDLSHFEARLAMYMASRVNWDNEVVMTQARMARAFKVPPSQICRALKTLEARAGCLDRPWRLRREPSLLLQGRGRRTQQRCVPAWDLFIVQSAE
jgi:hypothetical protein